MNTRKNQVFFPPAILNILIDFDFACYGKKSVGKHSDTLGVLNAWISCHVQHMGKGSADSMYDLDIESFWILKNSTIKAEIATVGATPF